MTFQTGRNRSTTEVPKLRLSNYRVALPTPPPTCDYTAAAERTLRNVYLNNQLGCCVISGGAHVRGVTSGNAGSEVAFSDADIRSMYRIIGGGGDNGASLDVAMRYWTKTGFTDGVKLLGWLAVDNSDPVEYKTALWLFENLYFGIECPNRWFNPMPQHSGFTWDVAGSPVPRNGHCFTGDTKVSLLNGKERSFAELASGIEGESFWVYSCDKAGNIVPGKAHSVRKTRENAPLVKVTLDNGESIRCTADHRFLMRDGTYRAAGMLAHGDSLMPLYRKKNDDGYELMYNPRTKGWRLTHRVAAFGVTCKTDGMVAHHCDFDKRNNSPDNLRPMTSSEHMRLHEETSAILNKYATSERGRERSRELMAANWANPEWAAKMRTALSASASRRGKRTAALGKSGLQTMSREQRIANGRNHVSRLHTPEVQSRAAEGLRRRLASDPELRRQWAEKARRNGAKNIGLKNHKVVSVEPAGSEDVYDMTVGEHHNFAISAGVFVHNCIAGVGYDAAGVQVSTWGMVGTLTDGAIERYCGRNSGGEMYVLCSPDMINKAQTKAPNGLNWHDLITDFNLLGGNLPVPPDLEPQTIDWGDII